MTNYKLLSNPKDFSNLEYGNVLDFLLKLRDTGLTILNAHNTITSPIDEGLTLDESCALEYIDSIESIDWETYDKLAYRVLVQMYFQGFDSTSLFIEFFESFKFCIAQLQNKINYAQDLDFATNFQETIETCVANLNYCILANYQMFYIYDDTILTCIKEYCALRQLDPKEFITQFIDYYKENRPTLSFFSRYPELAIQIESHVDPTLFEQLVLVSDILTADEIIKISKDELQVTEEFIESLELRHEARKGGGYDE